jgi:hypothetical protein
MKKILIISTLLKSMNFAFAQPGAASLEPANLIKDAENRTVTMQNGNMKNTPVISHWQLHGSGFQPTTSLGPGGFFLENTEHPEYSVVTQNAGAVPSAGMMAPIDLPENAVIQYFEACYFDRSAATNFPDCSLKFNFFRIADNGCPAELLASIVTIQSGNAQDTCPIRCTTQTVVTSDPKYLVNNKDYFYYVVAISFDDNGANGVQNCGNWATANLGIRGVEIEYARK